ncbi:MAG: YbhB/YbcL family Raf kinase inhibitor-like protein, partial [Anaerolineaceae bacterium]|nr:YbhB/YbcL family Raf kinase inhibitor-like protein [Anaerolineaceae bacterium]
MKSEILFGLCLLGLGLAGCGAAPEKNTAPDAKPFSGATPKTPAFVLTSSAFEANGDIPVRYTCDGEDISPPLTWRGAPEGTQNFVLIVDDPDAPLGTFTHWVLFDLPAERSELAEGASSDGALSALHGKTSFGKTAYGGPCPPSGVHHYIFTL